MERNRTVPKSKLVKWTEMEKNIHLLFEDDERKIDEREVRLGWVLAARLESSPRHINILESIESWRIMIVNAKKVCATKMPNDQFCVSMEWSGQPSKTGLLQCINDNVGKL